MTFTIQHKKVFRKIAAITTLCFVFLIILGITVPMLYKDKILNIIKTKANESLNARLDFQDLSLSLFKGFPNLQVDIDEFQLIGIDTFAQDTLLYAKNFKQNLT